MITIEDWHQRGSGGKQYKIKFSDPGSGMRGYSVWAYSPEEVHEAINHYWRSGPRASQHQNDEIEHCPLCRQGREEKEKRETKGRKLKVAAGT